VESGHRSNRTGDWTEARRAGLNPWVTIVGVVGHVRHERLEEPSPPQVYWSYAQSPQTGIAVVARTSGSTSALAAALPAAIREIDPDQPLYDVRTLEAVVDRTLARRWLQTVLLGGFAVLALLLAVVGVYGGIAYAVGQRPRASAPTTHFAADNRQSSQLKADVWPRARIRTC
jgi:hypothetical protein